MNPPSWIIKSQSFAGWGQVLSSQAIFYIKSNFPFFFFFFFFLTFPVVFRLIVKVLKECTPYYRCLHFFFLYILLIQDCLLSNPRLCVTIARWYGSINKQVLLETYKYLKWTVLIRSGKDKELLQSDLSKLCSFRWCWKTSSCKNVSRWISLEKFQTLAPRSERFHSFKGRCWHLDSLKWRW